MKKITIKDIAREAGVSPGAVSLVLNNQPCRIGQNTRFLIWETARKYNYQANPIARSMVTKKTKTIGVIIPDIENIFFSALVKTMESYCCKRGYMLLIVNSDDQFDQDLELLTTLLTRQIDGLFLVPSNGSFLQKKRAVETFSQISVPLVMIDRIYSEIACDKVSFDNRRGAYDAVSHLIEMGHRRIGCITIPLAFTSGKARYAGYMEAMHEHGLLIEPEFLFPGDYRLQSGYMAGQAMLPNTTAVFASNDMMALGYLKYLSEQGIRVPEDYSVVGYDDVVNPYLINMELTSVSQNVEKLGTAACEMMFSRLAGDKDDYRELSLNPELIKRSSTGRLIVN